jgi:hypothetical protein
MNSTIIDKRRYLVIAKRRGVIQGSRVVMGENNVPGAKMSLAVTHLGCDDIRAVQIGPALRLIEGGNLATVVDIRTGWST